MSADLTILILTKNEELNLPNALASVADLAQRVVVVDSGSTDRTVEIAREAGADVYENPFVNHAIQVNWGLDNTEISTPWIFRLDADEVVLPELARFLREDLDSLADDVDGIQIRRRIHFLGRWIKHGGCNPNKEMQLTSN
jgi:glycosyltransferase involved in cell wall biosynthesis